MQISPTLCRPRHLDPERLRARLGAEKYEKLRHHEAAVVSTAPMQFQLFALSSDTLAILPLMGRGKAAQDMCIAANRPARTEQRLELSRLLEIFAFDLVRARDDMERIHLINELTAAAYSSVELKQLFFEDRTQVQGCTGIALFLARQLSHPIRAGIDGKTRVELILSVVRTLDAMCFDMQLQTSCLGKLSLNELAGNLLARGAESYSVSGKGSDAIDMHLRVLQEDLVDAEAALLLSLDAVQQFEDFRLHQRQRMHGLLVERSTSVMQHVLRSPALSLWLSKFFKRLCIAVSRAAIAIENQQELVASESGEEEVEEETDEEDDEFDECEALSPHQMLSLWRSVTVLELLVKSDITLGSDQVLGELLRTRKDYIE
ncbi:unnamed protein product [Phytophthora fragariaefolia]|uniref:Unnamed protein product n=1 Tax=Phytophthora fragariaefolia TaxID=1490495 RepID=A0A9W6XNA3_9STRA|nr:unnamed protein product [Phytophthora fragariaefolia]